MGAPDISLASWFEAPSPRRPGGHSPEGATLTYRELWDRAERLTGGLRAGGVGPVIAAFLGLNQPAFFET